MELDPQLPVPRPLEIAVENGVFGWDNEGPCRPTEEHVRSLTSEHAREMLGLVADLAWLDQCASKRIDPQTGKPPRGNRGRERIDRIPAEAQRCRQAYENLLAVYEEGFGEPAASDLDRYVRSRLQPQPWEVQRTMF